MTCPHCGAVNDLHTGVQGAATPSPGDVSICIRCRCISIFEQGAGGLYVRKPTGEELRRAAGNPVIAQALAALAHVPGGA